MILATVLFVAALGVIATDRVDRTKVALLGAVLVLLTQTIEQDVAIEAIDWNTLGLLAGMMIVVRVTEPTGAYSWLAIRAAQLSKGRPFALVFLLALTTAVISAFLDNLTTILLVVPLTFVLADALDIDRSRWSSSRLLVSNIGGTATLIGDPPNIMIAGHTGLSFVDFIVRASTPTARSRTTASSSAPCRSSSPPRAAVGFIQFLKAGLPATFVSMLLVTGYIALRYL